KIPFVKKAILQLYQSLLFKKFTWVVDILYRTPLKNHLLLPKRKRANLKKIQAEGKPGETYDIMLYPGCVMTHFYPGLLEKTYNYLKKKGYSVVVPKNTKCCGFPYKTQGWGEKFEKLKSRNSKIFSRYKFKQVIAPCGTCVMALRDYYDMEGVKVWELTEFFKKHLSDAEVKSGALAADGKKVTWHDPCHHLKSLGLGDAPRHFMKQLGDDFVDDKSALCCGFGGIFSVGFPDTSKKIFQRKEEKLNELEAGTVVTACPGCYLQLSTKLQQEVKFFIELFDEEV
ncbi:MAG: (Fe-S)-binding protein, partial [bacterium]|nr:(Fe-S)-binding protein [bacterium]